MRNALIFLVVSVCIESVGVCVCEFVCAQSNVTESRLEKKKKKRNIFLGKPATKISRNLYIRV